MNNLINVLLSVFMVVPSLMAQKFEGASEPMNGLNSRYNEEFIAVHPSGGQIAFSRANHPYNQGGRFDEGDIWISKFDSIWHAATNWHEVNNDQISNPIGWSADGSTFLFNRVSTKGGELKTEIWAIAQGQLEQLEISYFKNKSIHQSGCISADNRYIILSMESGSTRGVEDLYVITRNGDKWNAPKNLGSLINTEFQEITPFLAPDNKTLYFATNGRKGFGSFDLFVTERLDDTWRNWSTPRNLGEAINTVGRETAMAFSAGSEYAYFVSTRNSDGYGDIRRIKFKSDDVTVDTTMVLLEIDSTAIVEVKENPMITGLRLVDAMRSVPISGQAKLKVGGAMRSVNLSDNGILELDGGQMGEIEMRGYLPVNFKTFSDSLVTVRLEPLEVGRVIRLESVLFSRGRAQIIESSFEELDRVVNMMKNNPDINILLKGHTDGNGDPKQNLELSEERAATVRKYLIGKGINRKRIESIGLGGDDPIASNATEETRKLNRRVEIEIKE